MGTWVYREVAIRYRIAGRDLPKNLFENYNVFVTAARSMTMFLTF